MPVGIFLVSWNTWWNGRSEDPDQTVPEGAVWSGSALFAKAVLQETLMYEILEHLQ